MAISLFQVEFVTQGAASASRYEIGREGRASSKVCYTLLGLEAADFQAITDGRHAGCERDLNGLGITVLPIARGLGSPAYQKMAASGKPAPAETRTKDTWSTVCAPAGLGLYGVGSSRNALALFAGSSAMSDVSKRSDGAVTGHRLLRRTASAAAQEAVVDAAEYRMLVAAGVGPARAMFIERLRAGR